jgi:hypothetical protein
MWGLLAGGGVGPFSRDIAGVWLLVYALVAMAPFGLVAGGLATMVCLWLWQTSAARRPLGWWLVVGGVVGFLTGSACPLVLMALGWGTDGDAAAWALVYAGLAGGPGGVCGVAIGAYSWRLRPSA